MRACSGDEGSQADEHAGAVAMTTAEGAIARQT
jgi:hypothetical protein